MMRTEKIKKDLVKSLWQVSKSWNFLKIIIIEVMKSFDRMMLSSNLKTSWETLRLSKIKLFLDFSKVSMFEC